MECVTCNRPFTVLNFSIEALPEPQRELWAGNAGKILITDPGMECWAACVSMQQPTLGAGLYLSPNFSWRIERVGESNFLRAYDTVVPEEVFPDLDLGHFCSCGKACGGERPLKMRVVLRDAAGTSVRDTAKLEVLTPGGVWMWDACTIPGKPGLFLGGRFSWKIAEVNGSKFLFAFPKGD